MFGNLMKARRQGAPKTDVKANELAAPLGEGRVVSGQRALRKGHSPLPIPGRPLTPAQAATAAAAAGEDNRGQVAAAVAADGRPGLLSPKGQAILQRRRTTTPRSKKAPVNAHSAFQKASLRKRIREKKGPKRYLDEVTVLGERVRLNEEGVSPQELARNVDFADFVYFTNKYFPPPTSEEGFTRMNEAKEVFSLIFHPSHGFNENEPIPPCADKDFSILKDCIEYRIGSLRDDVLAREQKYGDSVYTRQGVEHFLRLKKVADALNTAEGCRYYDPKNKSLSSGRRLDNISQERFENLLRQFSFLILQAMHPVKGYTENSQIDPVDFVKQLETDPIRSDDFMVYLAEYEQTHAQIPPILAKVLDVTGTENGVFNLVLEGKAKQIYEDIEKIMLDTLKGKLLSDFQIEMARVKELTHRERIQFSIKWLLDKYSGCIEQVAALQEERRALGEERNRLQRELGNIKGREEGLEGQVANAVAAQETAMAAAAATGPQVESANRELDAAREDAVTVQTNAEESIERLKAELLATNDERNRLEGALRETDGKIQAATDKQDGEMATIRRMLSDTQSKLAVSLSKNTTYETELSNLKSALGEASAQKTGLTQKKETRKAGLDREIGVLEARLADKMTELSALKAPGSEKQGGNAERLENVNRELAEIDRQLTAKRTQRLGDADELGQKLQLKNTEIGSLQAQIAQLEEIIRAGKESAPKPSVDMEKERLERELDAAKRGFESRHEMYEHLKREHQELGEKNRSLTANIASLEAAKSNQNSSDAATTGLQIETLKGELDRKTVEQERMAEELGTKKGEIEELRAQLAASGVELSKSDDVTAREVAAAVTASTQANKAEEGRLRATIADLTNQIQQLRAAPAPDPVLPLEEQAGSSDPKDNHEEKITRLETALAAANGTLAALEATIAEKEGSELELNRKVEEQAAKFGEEKAGLLSKVTQMAQAIENKSLSRENARMLFAGNEAFMNLYDKIMEYTSSSDNQVESKDICFLNYFITFFMKQLFFTGGNLEEKKDVMKELMATIDASPFASSPKDLETVLYQIYDLLYSSETFFLTQQRRDGVPASLADEGYYVLKDNDKNDVSKMIEFYYYIRDNGDMDTISKKLNRYIPEAFPDYFFKGSTVHFAFPTSESEEPILNYPGFVFLREPRDASQPLLKQRYMVIDKTNYSKSEERVEEGPVKQFITEIITGSKVDYTLLFTLFILVSRKYLLSNQSELEKYQCGITQYIRDPDSILDSAYASTGPRRDSFTYGGIIGNPMYRGDFAGLTEARRKSITSAHPPPLHVKGIPRPQ